MTENDRPVFSPLGRAVVDALGGAAARHARWSAEGSIRKHSPRARALAVLAFSAVGCMGVATQLRPYFEEDTTDDSAFLTILPAPGPTNLLSGLRDATTCQGAFNVGGAMELDEERTVRLPPGKEFAFTVNVFELVNGELASCEQMLVFTPAARTEYRATVRGSRNRCTIDLKRVVDGTEVNEMGARRRFRNGWECVD